MLIDLHVKSNASDGVSVDAEEIVQRAKERGLDAVVFTENCRTSHAKELVALGERHGIKVFVGIEISTDLGMLICIPPSIDDFLLEEEWRQATELTTPAADYVIEMVTGVGCAVIASRPYDLEIPHNMGDWIFRIEHIDAVEVFNPNVGRIQSDFAQEAAQSLALPMTGGSDPSDSLDNVGKYATFFSNEINNQADLVLALKSDTYWSILIGDVSQERSSRTPVARGGHSERPGFRRGSSQRGQQQRRPPRRGAPRR